MPVRQLMQLLALFAACLAIVGIAWASGSELYLFIPSRRFRPIYPPPTHPVVILMVLATSPILTYWVRQTGVYVFMIIAAGIVLGSAVGVCAFNWTPSWAQHLLTVAMIATSIYAWKQKYYFEE